MKRFVPVVCFCTSVIIFNSCTESTKGGSANSVDTTTVSSDRQPVTFTEVKPVSLSKEEAMKLLQAFLKKNQKTYGRGAHQSETDVAGGDYTGDGLDDYFFTVHFYEGGDFTAPTCFFYDSGTRFIRELILPTKPETIAAVIASTLSKNRISGEVHLLAAYDTEIMASRVVNSDFTIQGDKIVLDTKFIPALIKADKDMQAELPGEEGM